MTGKAKYALPVGEPIDVCSRNSRAVFAQSPQSDRNVTGSAHAGYLLRTIRLLGASSNYSSCVRDLAHSSFRSKAGLRNGSQQVAICPANVHGSSFRLQAGCRVGAFVVGKTGSRPTPISIFFDAGPNGAWMFRRALVNSSLVECPIRFRFASRVVFRASSVRRPNLSSLVVLAGVAGQVSGLMSSRAGPARRDCLPLITTPKQSLFSVRDFATFSCSWTAFRFAVAEPKIHFIANQTSPAFLPNVEPSKTEI